MRAARRSTWRMKKKPSSSLLDLVELFGKQFSASGTMPISVTALLHAVRRLSQRSFRWDGWWISMENYFSDILSSMFLFAWPRLAPLVLLAFLPLSILWKGGKTLETTWLLVAVAWFCTLAYWSRRKKQTRRHWFPCACGFLSCSSFAGHSFPTSRRPWGTTDSMKSCVTRPSSSSSSGCCGNRRAMLTALLSRSVVSRYSSSALWSQLSSASSCTSSNPFHASLEASSTGAFTPTIGRTHGQNSY